MKIGDKVRITKDMSGPFGTFRASTPFQDEFVEVTEQNIAAIEDLLRGGAAEMAQETQRPVKLMKEADEVAPVLSDSTEGGTRGRKRPIQPREG